MAAIKDPADPAMVNAAETKKSQNRAPGARRVALVLGAQSWALGTQAERRAWPWVGEATLAHMQVLP